MRVILDECLPRQLGRELVGHTVTTVANAGWSGVLNGRLLALINGLFDAFLTVDKNLPKSHAIVGLSFCIVVLRATSNDISDLKPLVPEILSALAILRAGQIATVAARGFSD